MRGVTSAVDPARPVEGSYLGFLTFDNRAAATITFNGYGYFNSHELTWDFGEERKPEAPDRHARAHQRMREFNSQEQEWELKNSLRYGGERSGQWASVGHYRPGGDQDLHQPFFGFTIVTCEKSDIRQSPDGLYVYTSEGTQEIPVERAGNPRWHELYRAWSSDSSLAFNDGRWGRATLEVCLAIRDSGREGRELEMTRQVPYAISSVSR